MKLTNYNIEWSYKARKVWISHQGDMTFPTVLGSDKIYDIHSSGCCYLNWKKKELENVYRLFTALIREGFDVQDTYRQFLKINKFRQNEAISILDIISA
jgi:hypothetical protein